MASKLDTRPAQERVSLAELPIAIVTGFGCGLTVLYLLAIPLFGRTTAVRDFVSFWATGHQLVHRGNPYDCDAIAALEHSAGLNPGALLMMRNPPWAFALILPLGFLGLHVACAVWLLLLVSCQLLSVHWIREMHGSPPNHTHWLGLGFTPALISFVMGQTSLFMLFGLVLFLRLHRSRPFWAGAALWFCALKPQLFLPFGVVLLAWVVFTRSYRLLAGAVTALSLTTFISYLVCPTAWTGYIHLMRSPAVENDFIPCLSYMLRHWLWPHAVWLQYMPAAFACIWALIYFWRRRAAWDWVADSSPLMLVSLLTAPYAWFYDQCLAIPALLHAGYLTSKRWMLTILALVILVLYIAMFKIMILSAFYLWTMPVWLAWYLFARAFAGKPDVVAISGSYSPANSPPASAAYVQSAAESTTSST